MTYQQLQDKIVSAFWSEGLKKHIRETGYVFPPEKLLSLAYKHTSSFTERLDLMALFAETVPEVSDHAMLVIRWMEGRLREFREPDANTVFDLRIDPDGDDDTLDYLCGTFDTCLSVIDRFYEGHPWTKETDHSVYTIIKKRILQPGEPLDVHFELDCALGPGKVVTRVPMGMTCEFGDCEGDCACCEHICVEYGEALIPPFIPDLSAVRYRALQGDICYGCVLTAGSDGWESYVIPLDSSMFEDDLEEHWHSLHHEHVPWPNVESVTPEELSEPLRKNYDTFIDFWKNKYPHKYKEAAE